MFRIVLIIMSVAGKNNSVSNHVTFDAVIPNPANGTVLEPPH